MDYVLGDRPRFVLPRMEPGERREVTYAIRSHVRGRHQLGPLGLRVRDPFGLATVATALPGATEVTVLPRVEPLGGGHPRGDGVGAEGAIPHMVALHGEDDVAIRELPRRRRPAPDPLARDRAPRRAHGPPGGPAGTPPGGRGPGLPLQRSPGLGRVRLVRVGRHRRRVDRRPPHGAELCGAPGQRRDRGRRTGRRDHRRGHGPGRPGGGRARRPGDAPSRCCTRPTRSPRPVAWSSPWPPTTTRTRCAGSPRCASPAAPGCCCCVEAATFAGPAPPSSDSRAESLAGLVAAAGWSTAVVRAGTGVGAVWSALTASSGVTVGVRR